ncbi:MAG: methyltransferase type 11, partial [Chloroflexi bacterium]|nr:methyltransferase type 11 [Chloroflexota bacterium]
MHQDVVDLNAFYLTRLGRVTRRILGQQIRRVWPRVREEVVLGIGYPVPFLGLFREEADRVFAVMPAGQGVMAWPESGGRQVALADDGVLPLPDGCIDRILIVHGLEFSEQRR